MSDNEMRETVVAAHLMRTRAEAATPGPWAAHIGGDLHEDSAGWVGAPGETTTDGLFVASVANALEGLDDVGHIASWHPGVARLVADLLDEVSAHSGTLARFAPRVRLAADRVARSYLGDGS